MTLVDSHGHVDVDRTVVTGGIAMAKRYPFIDTAAGVHPREAAAGFLEDVPTGARLK